MLNNRRTQRRLLFRTILFFPERDKAVALQHLEISRDAGIEGLRRLSELLLQPPGQLPDSAHPVDALPDKAAQLVQVDVRDPGLAEELLGNGVEDAAVSISSVTRPSSPACQSMLPRLGIMSR